MSRTEDPDDPEFHAALRRRDPDAFSRLVGLFGARILGLARQYAPDRDEADDLVQEIFLEIYRSLPKFRGDAALYTFLFRIALNRSARTRTRARAREARLPILPSGSDGHCSESVPFDSPSPSAAAEKREENSMAEKALAGLDPSHRAALYLRAAEGLSYPEIASILGCPTGTVKSRIFFARLRVSEALGLESGVRREPSEREGDPAATRQKDESESDENE